MYLSVEQEVVTNASLEVQTILNDDRTRGQRLGREYRNLPQLESNKSRHYGESRHGVQHHSEDMFCPQTLTDCKLRAEITDVTNPYV